jgi:hypothetical protein
VLTGTWERADAYVDAWGAARLVIGMMALFATLAYIVWVFLSLTGSP